MTAPPARLGLFYGAIFLVLGILGPFWPLWLKDHGLRAEDIGLVFAIGLMSKLVVTPPVTRRADRTGERKRLLAALTLLAALAFGLFHFARGLGPIALITVVYFACWAPIIPLTESLTMLTRERLAREGRGFDYGRVRLWGSVTFIIGAVGMGRVLTGGPVDWIHWAITGAICLTFVASLFLPETQALGGGGGDRPIRAAARIPGLVPAILAATCIQASHAVYYGFATLHWRSAGHSPDVIGGLWAEGVIVEIILFSAAGRIIRRTGALPLVLAGAAAGMVRWTGTAMTTDLSWLLCLQALHGLTFGAAHLGIIHFISERVPPSLSASAQGLYAMTMGIGMSVSAYAAGQLYGAFGGHAFLAMSGLALFSAAFGIRALAQPANGNGRAGDAPENA